MLAPLILALALAAPPAENPAAPPTSAAAPKTKDAAAPPPVDENGVPAWAKRRRQQAVQACETKPGIGIDTWRQHYDNVAAERLKPRPPAATCR